jgi:hypothetical protein
LPGNDLAKDTVGRHSGSSRSLAQRYTRVDRENTSDA